MFWPPRLPSRLPHKGDGCGAPPPAQFARRIDEQHPGLWVGSLRGVRLAELAPQLPGEARAVEEGRDFGSAFHMPWHDHESQPWMRLHQGVEGSDGQLLLRGLRAAGKEDDIVIVEARQLTQSRHLRGLPVPLHAIELHRAGHGHVAAPRRRERGEAVGIFLRSRDHERHLAEHPAHERANPAVAPPALLAHPRVGHDDRDATGMNACEEVWPEFQFAQHEDVGTHAVEHAVDGPGEVERAGKRLVGAEPLGGDVEARGRGTGNDTVDPPAVVFGLAANLGGQYGEQLHLADAHAVEPDSRHARVAAGQGSDAAGEPHPGIRDRSPARELPPCDPRQEDHEGDEVDGVEQHGREGVRETDGHGTAAGPLCKRVLKPEISPRRRRSTCRSSS
jgi:hypothetical protein